MYVEKNVIEIEKMRHKVSVKSFNSSNCAVRLESKKLKVICQSK